MPIFSKKILPLGLDISDMSVKFVQLNKRSDKFKLQALGKIDLPSGVVEKGEIKNKKVLIDNIVRLLSKPKHGSINSREVVASLPDTKTFIKLITIEKSANDLKTIIEPEIEKHIPLLLKEIYFDWQLISETSDRYYVLIGAAPKILVDDYCNILRQSNLIIKALEIESMPICRSVLVEESSKAKLQEINYGILDIGAKKTTLIFYSKSSIIMNISMPISGDEITDRIANTLEIKKDQAEKAKIICGFDKSIAQGIVSDILSDMIKELTIKIGSAIEFYNTHYSELGAINQILLTGGGANIKNLDRILGETTGFNFTLANPLLHIKESDPVLKKCFNEIHDLNINKDLSKNMTAVQNNATSYTVPIGLSLRNF